MSLYGLLQKRQAINRPVRIGVVGAGTFSSAFLNQARRESAFRRPHSEEAGFKAGGPQGPEDEGHPAGNPHR